MAGGLLDFAKTPMGMGLLSAAFGGLAGANRDTPWNNLGRAGLAGVAGYSAADALQQKQVELDKAKAIQDAIPTLYKTDASGNTTFDTIGGAKIGIDPATLKQYAELPNAGRAKVARTITVPGADGRPVTVQYDDYGQRVGEGVAKYEAPQLVDMGDRKQFVTPQAGQSFAVGLSPAERDASARGWAGVTVRQENNRLIQDANDINRTATRTQVVTGADGKQYLIDKGTGEARLATTQQGAPVLSGQGAIDASKRERDANDSLELLALVEKTLPGATDSGIGAATDSVQRFFGRTSEGAQRAAQLEAIGGTLVMKMPRMEGPQSNMDQLLYREMAGKVGDRTVPAEEREAAMKTLRQLLGKYSTNGAPAQPGAAPPVAPAAPAGQQLPPVTGKFLGFE